VSSGRGGGIPEPGRDLVGQRAIVTGGSSGIGAGIVRAFAAAGAEVILNYRSSGEKAARIAAEVEAGGGRVATVQADVSHPEGCTALFDAAVDAFRPEWIRASAVPQARSGRRSARSCSSADALRDGEVCGLALLQEDPQSRIGEAEDDRPCGSLAGLGPVGPRGRLDAHSSLAA
jgi:hypothetical protein